MSMTLDQLSSSAASQSAESNADGKESENLKNLELSTEAKTNDSSVRTYDLIAEEPEEEISRSESVEQLSESISKMESENSFGRDNIERKNINNNDSFGSDKKPKAAARNLKNVSMNRSIQTSHFSEITNLKNANKITYEASRSPIKIIEPSFLSKLKQEGEMQKPVYVLYPNYVLPDLDFLNNQEQDVSKLLLLPQKPHHVTANKKRPFSCNDVESLKRRGFSHIRDWDSLNFLLPQEYKKILADVPEISEHIKTNIGKEKPSFIQNKFKSRRPMSCEITQSSSSSTATQPSSGKFPYLTTFT